MRKWTWLCLLAVWLLVACGCDAGKRQYDFPAQGVRIFLSDEDRWNITAEVKESGSTLAFFDADAKEYVGFISVSSAEKNQDIEPLYKGMRSNAENAEEADIQKLHNCCLFEDYHGTSPNGADISYYFFLCYDNRIPAQVYGRFYSGSIDKESVLRIAESISIKEIEKVSPYPEDYTEIQPDISIGSSGERVTEYCVIPKEWKGRETDVDSYEKLLENAKTYMLDERDHIVVQDGNYDADTFNATVSFKEGSLYWAGAAGFQVSKPTEPQDEPLYVFVTTTYGRSGTLLYVFKCAFA